MTTRPDRHRRSGGDTDTTRSRLLDAASEAFRRQGYVRCSTRQIADDAGVAETLLFRHFGSKAQLFDAAVRARFEDAVAGFVASWSELSVPNQGRGDAVGSPARAERFLHELCALVSAHRADILALMTVDAFEDTAPPNGVTMRGTLAALQDLVRTHVPATPPDTEAAPREAAVMALVLGTLVLDDSVWADAQRPATAVVTAEVTAIALCGVSGRSRRRRVDQRDLPRG